jgi:hypothetical protein
MAFLTIFIVPDDAQCTLTDDGWFFASGSPISKSAVEKVIEHFDAHLGEEFLGIRKYQGGNTQINLVYDNDHSVSEVSVRTDLGRDEVSQLRTKLVGESVVIRDSKGVFE